MVAALRKAFAALRALERTVLIAGILAMAAVTIANVFARTILNNSLTFADEINRHLVLLVTFVGLSYATGRARHIRMSALFDALPHRARKILATTICGVNAALMFVLAWYAARYTHQVWADATVSSALRLPLWATYLPVTAGCAMAGLQYTLAFLRNCVDRRRIFMSFEIEHGYDDDPQAQVVEA